MKTDIEGQKYRIRFVYGESDVQLWLNRRVMRDLAMIGIELKTQRRIHARVSVPRRVTRCIIERVLPEEIQVISDGFAVCNPVDNFVKETGRIKSLGRAVSRLPDDLGKFAQQFFDAYEHRRDAPAVQMAA
jgi:hypothetical protein